MAMLKAKIQAELQQSGRNKQRQAENWWKTNGGPRDLALVLALVYFASLHLKSQTSAEGIKRVYLFNCANKDKRNKLKPSRSPQKMHIEVYGWLIRNTMLMMYKL